MSPTLERFMDLLVGRFHNERQYKAMEAEGIDYVYAQHVNTICNDKIKNLPEDFAGVFLLEESYYHVGQSVRPMHHLFLFTEKDGVVTLTSYAIPEGYSQKDFTYDNLTTLDYNDLSVSEKFTPAHYHEKDGVWEGGSTSQFSPTLTFILRERFSEKGLEVMEVMENNEKRTFGYDTPIFYERM